MAPAHGKLGFTCEIKDIKDIRNGFIHLLILLVFLIFNGVFDTYCAISLLPLDHVTATYLLLRLELVVLAGGVGPPLKVMHTLRHGDELWCPLKRQKASNSTSVAQ